MNDDVKNTILSVFEASLEAQLRGQFDQQRRVCNRAA